MMTAAVSDHTSRMAALLGRLRREMNGAVVEAMERAGVKGVFNYGVSIPTIRAIAAETGRDHAFARFLYRQQVRELRMAALSIADPTSVTPEEIDFWLSGSPSVELLDELALRLLSRSSDDVLQELAGRRLTSGEAPECYAALMTLSRTRTIGADELAERVAGALLRFPDDRHVARAAAACGWTIASEPGFAAWLRNLPDTAAGRFVREELRFLLD